MVKQVSLTVLSLNQVSSGVLRMPFDFYFLQEKSFSIVSEFFLSTMNPLNFASALEEVSSPSRNLENI